MSIFRIALYSVLIGVLTACASTNNIVPSPQQRSNGLRVFDGNDCFGDGGNCLPEVVVYGHHAAHARAIAELDQAVSTNSTSTYFSSGRSRYLLPALELHPRLQEVLRSGTPMFRLDRPNGKRFYVATKLTREELVRRIESNTKGRAIAGVEVCISVSVR